MATSRRRGSLAWWAGALRAGVRVRVLATVLGLAAVGLLLAEAADLMVQRNQLRQRVDRALASEVAEFRDLAGSRPRAADGQPVTGVRDLLTVALRQHLPERDEIFFGMVNGRLALLPAGQLPVSQSELSPLVTQVSRLAGDASVRLRDVHTPAGRVRFAAVPVRVEGASDVGVYVAGTLMGPQEEVIAQNSRQFGIVSLAALTLVGMAGWLVAGRLLLPLRLLEAAARGISSTDLSLRIPVRGRDDVSELTRTVNAMLDRLQGAFESQQRFLDDAGHELRTPLTIVRGHMEVLQVTDPHDVADTRALVLDELDRMSRLVDDLIVLARAGRPDFVRRASFDVDHLIREVIDKGQALGARRWCVDGLAGGSITADAQRLTQALLQLAENAVKYTRPGDEIGVGAVREAGAVRLWVRDTGPGVDPHDVERIFERFGRAGGTGRGAQGSGLGLSIVTAIAAAHQGRVGLDNTPGHGARFWLTIPAKRATASLDPPDSNGEAAPVADGRLNEAVRAGVRRTTPEARP